MIRINKILLKLIIWILINTVIALVISSFLSIHIISSFMEIFLPTLIITQIISSLCEITGYSLGYYFKKKPLIIELPVVLAGTLFAAIIGYNLSQLIINKLFYRPFSVYKSIYFTPSLLIAAVVTIISLIIEHLNEKQNVLKHNLENITNASKKRDTENASISIKENDNYCIIRSDDLIYLSSHGKKTTLHTTEKDYETNQLLKDIENKLPESFIRIHRQFIINIKFISQIKYNEGGRYMAYLKDEDESALPVGRKIAPFLKEKLGI